MTSNTSATLKIYINQGFNMTGANFAKTALNGLVTQISDQYSTNLIGQLGDQQIDANQASVLVHPVVSEEKVFNTITTATANGSAPTLLAVPAWVGALIGGFIVFLATSSIFKKKY